MQINLKQKVASSLKKIQWSNYWDEKSVFTVTQTTFIIIAQKQVTFHQACELCRLQDKYIILEDVTQFYTRKFESVGSKSMSNCNRNRRQWWLNILFKAAYKKHKIPKIHG